MPGGFYPHIDGADRVVSVSAEDYRKVSAARSASVSEEGILLG